VVLSVVLIARIHKSNLINFGIIPLIFKNKNDYNTIALGDKVKLPDIRKLIEQGASEIPVEVAGRRIVVILDVSDRQRKILLAGSMLNLAKE